MRGTYLNCPLWPAARILPVGTSTSSEPVHRTGPSEYAVFALLQPDATGPDLVRLVVNRAVEALAGMRRLPTNKTMRLPDITVALAPKVDQVVQLLASAGGKRMVLLHGMAGMGKTTLAKAVFNALHERDRTLPCHFARLNPEMKQPEDVVDEQRGILKELAHVEAEPGIQAVAARELMLEALQGKTVLLVVDNVWEHQLQWLLPENIMEILGAGSMVLVTSRESWAVEERSGASCVEAVEADFLTEQESLELFCQLAFGSSDCPADEMEPVCAILARCQGLPLALEVVGRHLLETGDAGGFFRRMSVSLAFVYSHQRACRFERQETVFDALSVSWDALEDEQKETLLDVVWFLQGQPLQLVESLCDVGVLNRLNRLGLVKWGSSQEGSGEQLVEVHQVLADFCKMFASSNSGMRLELLGKDVGECSVEDVLSMVRGVVGSLELPLGDCLPAGSTSLSLNADSH
jgi:adenylate kinase